MNDEWKIDVSRSGPFQFPEAEGHQPMQVPLYDRPPVVLQIPGKELAASPTSLLSLLLLFVSVSEMADGFIETTETPMKIIAVTRKRLYFQFC